MMSSNTRPQRRKMRFNDRKDYREVDPMRGPRFDRSEYRTDLLMTRRDVRQTIDIEKYLDEEMSR